MDSDYDTSSEGSASVDDRSARSSQDLPVDNFSRSARRSVDDFLRDLPPTYSDTLLPPASLSRLKLPVQPRPDEGKEVLPCYSTAICLQHVFRRKMELENAIHRAQDRNWSRVIVTLQGTALTFHKCSATSFFSGSGGRKHSADFPIGTKAGVLLKSYNLQHAEVGIAADYQKKQYVIRMRVETDQFLLSCHKIETFVTWLHALSTAIDLAPPLDDRDHPSDYSIPRSRRRSPRRRSSADTALNATEETPETTSSSPTMSPTSSTESLTPSPTREPQSDPISAPEPRRIPLPLQSSPPPPRSAFSRNSTTNSNVTSDGKWRPHHHWTHFYDMLYAKRCMAILATKSPRKSNFLVKDKALWWIDWSSGEMSLCAGNGAIELAEHKRIEREMLRDDPPGYNEPVRMESVSTSASIVESIPDILVIDDTQPVTLLLDEFDTPGKMVERIEIRRLDTIGI